MELRILGATHWIHDKIGINLTVFRVILIGLLLFFPKTIIVLYMILGIYVILSQPARCRNCGTPLISHETTCSHCGVNRSVHINFSFIFIFIALIGIVIGLSFLPFIGLAPYVKPYLPEKLNLPAKSSGFDSMQTPTEQTPPQDNPASQPQTQTPVTDPVLEPEEGIVEEVPVVQTPPEIVIDDSTKIFFDGTGLNTQYSDSFEVGLRWGRFGLGEKNRTQDIVNLGEHAVKLNGTETGVVFDIGQLLSNTIFVCHLYDGGNITFESYCGASVNQTLALNRTILIGVGQKDSKYYSYFDPFGSLWVTTKIPRLDGWHKLTIETNGLLNYLYIDDELVGTIDSYTHWRFPFMVNYGAGVSYFDDVAVYQRQKLTTPGIGTSGSLTNFALGKNVSSSCSAMTHENYSMISDWSRLTNGNYVFDAANPVPLNDSRYEYLQCNNNACVTVDLGQVYTLRNVVAYNWLKMQNLQNMTMRENTIQVSKDSTVWRTVFNFSSQGDYPTFNGPQKISFTAPKDARYVRQCIDGNLLDGNSTWFQIEAWG